jgi:hypothetical protein
LGDLAAIVTGFVGANQDPSCSVGGNKEALVKAIPKGQYIKHFQYGLGVITESNEERTSIDFDLHGPKKFVTALMVVDLAEGTPPKRRRAKRTKKAAATPIAAAAAGAK